MEQTEVYDPIGSTDEAEAWSTTLPRLEGASCCWSSANAGLRDSPPTRSFARIEALVRDLPPIEEL